MRSDFSLNNNCGDARKVLMFSDFSETNIVYTLDFIEEERVSHQCGNHEKDWPPCKVEFFGLATNTLNVRNNVYKFNLHQPLRLGL